MPKLAVRSPASALWAGGDELTGSYTISNGQSGTWDVTR